MFAHPFAAVGKIAVFTLAKRDFFDDFRQIVGISEGNIKVRDTVFLELHGERERGGERNRVHAEQVALIVEAQHVLHADRVDIRPEETAGFVFRAFDILAVHLDAPFATDRAGDAGAVA